MSGPPIAPAGTLCSRPTYSLFEAEAPNLQRPQRLGHRCTGTGKRGQGAARVVIVCGVCWCDGVMVCPLLRRRERERDGTRRGKKLGAGRTRSVCMVARPRTLSPAAVLFLHLGVDVERPEREKGGGGGAAAGATPSKLQSKEVPKVELKFFISSPQHGIPAQPIIPTTPVVHPSPSLVAALRS